VRACDYSLTSLEEEVAELANRLEGDVNVTVSEISLEMEIIVLQHFETAAKALDAAADAALAPTDAIFAEYDALLQELVPDVHPSLASAAAGAAASGQSLAPAPREALLAADEAPRQPSTPTSGASPLTAALVVLGALFAGVAAAGGGRVEGWGPTRQQRYEALL